MKTDNEMNCQKCEFFIDYCQNINTINRDKYISFCVIKTGRSMRLFDKRTTATSMLGYSTIRDAKKIATIFIVCLKKF